MLLLLAGTSDALASDTSPPDFPIPSTVDLYSERLASVRLLTPVNGQWAPKNIYAFSEDGGVVISENKNADDVYEFFDLSTEVPYTFFYVSQDQQVIGIGESRAKHLKGDWIDISLDFHHMLRDWMLIDDPSKEALYDAVVNSRFDEFSKAAFLQKYFYGGEEFSSVEDILSEKNLAKYDYDKSLMTCSCNGVRVPARYRIEPGFIPDIFTNGLIQPDRRLPFVHELDQNKLEYYTQSTGPAKLWIAYSDGRKENINQWYGGSVGSLAAENEDPDSNEDVNALSQRITQVFTQLCTSNIGDLSQCNCIREVDLHFFYESTVNVYAEIGSGSGNKRSSAIGEDIAVAFTIQEKIVDGERTADFNYIAGFQNLESTTCNVDINTQFNTALGQTLGALGGLGATLVIGTGTTGSNQQQLINGLRSQFITQIVAQGATLFTNPRAPSTTPCTQVTASEPKVIDVPALYSLKPQEPLYASIASGAQMVSTGMRSWQSDVVIASDFYLTANFPGGLEVNNNSDCCTSKSYGFYWGKSLDGELATNNVHVSERFNYLPPSFTFEIRELLSTSFSSSSFVIEGDFIFNEYGARTVPFDYGTLIFGPFKDPSKVCQERYEGGDQFGDINGDVICSDCIWSGSGGTDKLFRAITGQRSSEVTYEVYSMDGRRVGLGNMDNLIASGVFSNTSRGLSFNPVSLFDQLMIGAYVISFNGPSLKQPVSLKFINK
jgi:hypothetical protein